MDAVACRTESFGAVLVTPLPSVRREQLLAAIRDIRSDLTRARSWISSIDGYNGYITWANTAAERLYRLVVAADIDRLVLTRRYWTLQSIESPVAASTVTLLNVEMDERLRIFGDVEAALVDIIGRWSRHGLFALPDSSFYIRHPVKLEEADFRTVLAVREEPVHLLVPMVVVDELDGLKRSGEKHARWRAGYTLAVLDHRLVNPTVAARLREEDFSPLDSGGIPRGEVSIEILFDPAHHVRLPINDDEIIDRALAAQTFADRPITIVTYDTGQAMRARRAGLPAVKLNDQRDDEPPRRSPHASGSG